ncbi:MAG: ketol-acid reductoisomerase [candidate division Zixibacteria bacterium]|nr:ketol-acid reductoisomerase [candidate division Zixibacteria bacterium]
MKETCAVLGYGSQGRAWALNLRDSGVEVVIGLKNRSTSRSVARRDGFTAIITVGEAVKRAEVVIMAVPDHVQGRLFKREISANLQSGSALVFLHGFSVHFKTVAGPSGVDVILLAPLGPGHAVREKYLAGESVGFFYAIGQNGTGRARQRLDGLIDALKINRKTLIKTSFADEAIGDLFGEQAVLCGGLTQLIMTGFTTLRKAGLSADKAYLEVAYQLDLIVDLIKRFGIAGMYDRISLTACYGSREAGPRVIDRTVECNMQKLFNEITSGRYAKRLNALTPDAETRLRRDIMNMTSPDFERAARKFSPERKKK